MIKYVAMSGVIYLKIQNRFREFSQGGAAATAGASVVSGLVVGSVACAQSRALEDDPDGPPRDRRWGREWGWWRILGLWLKSHGRCQAQRDVVFCRTLCEECISFLHPTLMEGVPARASLVLW